MTAAPFLSALQYSKVMFTLDFASSPGYSVKAAPFKGTIPLQPLQRPPHYPVAAQFDHYLLPTNDSEASNKDRFIDTSHGILCHFGTSSGARNHGYNILLMRRCYMQGLPDRLSKG